MTWRSLGNSNPCFRRERIFKILSGGVALRGGWGRRMV